MSISPEHQVERGPGPRLEPVLFSCFTARLKARPDTNLEVFPQVVQLVPFP